MAVKRPVAAEGIAPYIDRDIAALRLEGIDVTPFELRLRKASDIIPEIWRLRRAIAAQSIDIVHAHFGDLVGFSAAIASWQLAHLVVTFRGSDLNPAPAVARLRMAIGHLMSHAAAMRATRIICVSDELRERLIWGRARATVLPTGVPTNIFHPQEREASRARLEWPPDRPIVLFNAGPAPGKKRADRAERAVRLARKILVDLELVTLNGTVPQDRVALMLNAADCLLICSDYEGSPTILQEAMACNTPVVSTNAGDAAMQLDGIESCRVVASDEDAIANGAAKAKTSLDCGVIARKVASLYKSLDTQSRGNS
jgi:teichuronic acid biosynthesis glycosyltransferase TuaC